MTAPTYPRSTSLAAPTSPLLELRKIPFRDPNSPADPLDGRRAELVRAMWDGQNAALRLRDREIEENIRMLAGQQWTIFNPITGRWIDITQFLSDDERRWRQRPVFNRLLPWFMLTHARFTENPPILTFVPGPDRSDAELAETMDTIFKVIWREADANDAWDRCAAWLLVAGSGYIQSRIDLVGGPMMDWTGQGEVPLVDANMQPVPGPDGQPVMVPMENVPFDEQGQPVAVAQVDPNTGQPVLVPIGEAHKTRRPRIALDVLSPLEVRGEWGPTPWQQKSWHMSRHFLPPETVFNTWGREVTPTPMGALGGYGTDSGELSRILFGAGYHGPSTATLGGDSAMSQSREGLVDLFCFWQRPLSDSDGGRYIVTTAEGACLFDGPRPVQYPNTSPIRRFEFVRMPGRASGGLTPMSSMRGPQRALNKRWAQLFEHAALVSNPKPLIDSSQMDPAQWTNEPGKPVSLNTRRPGAPPVEWVAPPPLGQDVWRLMGELREELADLGMLKGTEGETPTADASGELIKELRFNSDRAFGPSLRRAPDEWGRVAQDWQALIPTVYPFEHLISYAGEDNVARTLLLRPQLFKEGKINVVADAESMLPEGRGERQARVYRFWREGAFGIPASPLALRTMYDLMRFPHMSRIAKPGGVDRTTAEQENGRLVQGAQAMEIPAFEWYDHFTHLDVHESLMKSPEFLKLDVAIQEQFALHRQAHRMALMATMPQAPAGPPEEGGGGGGGEDGQDPQSQNPALFPGAPSNPQSVEPGMMPGAM